MDVYFGRAAGGVLGKQREAEKEEELQQRAVNPMSEDRVCASRAEKNKLVFACAAKQAMSVFYRILEAAAAGSFLVFIYNE